MWVPLVMQPRFDRGMSLLERPNVGWLRVVGRLRPGATESTADAALAVAVTRLQSEATEFSKYARRIAVRDRRTAAAACPTSVNGSRCRCGFSRASSRSCCSSPARTWRTCCWRARLPASGRWACAWRSAPDAAGWFVSCSRRACFWRRSAVRSVCSWHGGAAASCSCSPRATAAPIPIDVGLNAHVLVFTSALSLVTVVVFGLAPALTVSRGGRGNRPETERRHADEGEAFQRPCWSRRSLFHMVLLTGAALFGRTLRNLRTRDLGFAADALVEVRIAPQASGYKTEQLPDLSRRLVDRLASAPGVESAAFTHAGFGGGISTTCCVAVAGYAHEPGEDRQIRTLGVAPGYFRTLRLPLLRGRDFTAQDSRLDPNQISVAVVNEAFVRRYLDGRDPIGARFGWGDPPNVKYADRDCRRGEGCRVRGSPRGDQAARLLPVRLGRHLRRARRGFARRRHGDASTRSPGGGRQSRVHDAAPSPTRSTGRWSARSCSRGSPRSSASSRPCWQASGCTG